MKFIDFFVGTLQFLFGIILFFLIYEEMLELFNGNLKK
jgi:hypothetical protein